MKLSIAKAELQKGLARIQSIVEKRNTMPILANVLLEARKQGREGMLDLAAHVVAREGLGVPDELAASFELLKRAGILDEELADRMRRMTGFRNVAVHEYRKLDPGIVDSIVRDRLGDLRAFARTVLERFRI